MHTEEEYWQKTKALLGNESISLGPFYTFQLRKTPRRFFITLAYYKFAAKVIGTGKSVIELGCGEGLGSILTGEFAKQLLGVDFDHHAIEWAKKNFESEQIEFREDNFLGKKYGEFDAVMSLDVIEHITPDNDDLFWETLKMQLSPHGMAVIGTPNETSQVYASAHTRAGHINLYNYERFKTKADEHFHNHILFSANDETIHTGFYPMAHYLMMLCFSPRQP